MTWHLSVKVGNRWVAGVGGFTLLALLFILPALLAASLQTRYFSLSAENNLFDFFWVNEQPAWLWWFAF